MYNSATTSTTYNNNCLTFVPQNADDAPSLFLPLLINRTKREIVLVLCALKRRCNSTCWRTQKRAIETDKTFDKFEKFMFETFLGDGAAAVVGLCRVVMVIGIAYVRVCLIETEKMFSEVWPFIKMEIRNKLYLINCRWNHCDVRSRYVTTTWECSADSQTVMAIPTTTILQPASSLLQMLVHNSNIGLYIGHWKKFVVRKDCCAVIAQWEMGKYDRDHESGKMQSFYFVCVCVHLTRLYRN